jgi:DNA-binding LacI/PurR family transcriptional regulator
LILNEKSIWSTTDALLIVLNCDNDDQLKGYKKALEDHNIPFDSSLVYPCKNVTFEEGKQFAEKIVNMGKEVVLASLSEAFSKKYEHQIV